MDNDREANDHKVDELSAALHAVHEWNPAVAATIAKAITDMGDVIRILKAKAGV